MDDQNKAPEGYTYPFATESDNYTFDDYWEDLVHFSTLMQQGNSAREFGIPYFQAHYPPEERSRRCLNLYWAIEAFVGRVMQQAEPAFHGDLVSPPDRFRRAAWAFYSAQSHNAGITDDIAIVAVANILQESDA